MEGLTQFRIFYNQSIHPELVRLERNRKRLLRLMAMTLVFLALILIFEATFQVLPLTLLLLALVGFYISWIVIQLRKFVLTFKPRIVSLVLDFIDNSPSYGTLAYDASKAIPAKRFEESDIFVSDSDFYQGEDFIYGKIGEIPFEMCELQVKESSKVRNRLNYIFQGVFMVASLNHSMNGQILIFPKVFRQYLSRSIRLIVRHGGKMLREGIQNADFLQAFEVYATPDAPVTEFISRDMQAVLVAYREQNDKEIYLSYKGRKLYVAVAQNKDMLEPKLFSSNARFELVRAYFEDLKIVLEIVEDIDSNH